MWSPDRRSLLVSLRSAEASAKYHNIAGDPEVDTKTSVSLVKVEPLPGLGRVD